MGGALKEFFVSLGLDSDAASWAAAITQVDGLEKLLSKLVDGVISVSEHLADSVIETGKYGSELDDTSKKTGFATQALEEYTYAAKLVGGSSETLVSAATHLGRKMGEVRSGSKEATEAFARLGVRVFDNHGKMRNLEDVMDDVADGLKKTEPGAERMAAAFGVMGKGGADAIPLFADGSEALKRMREEFRLTVGVMTEEQVGMADRFDDSLVTLRAVKDFLTRQFAMPIIEALQPMIDGVLEWRRANKALIDNAVTNWGKRVAEIVTTIGKVVEVVVQNWTRVSAILKTIGLTMLALGAIQAGLSLQMIIAAGSAAAAWLAAAAPFIAMVAAVALAVLAIDDLITFLEGGHSLIGELGPKWTKFVDEFTKVNPDDPWWLRDLKLALAIMTDIQGFMDNPNSFFNRHLGKPPGPKGAAVSTQDMIRVAEQNPGFVPNDRQREMGMLSSQEVLEKVFPPTAIGPHPDLSGRSTTINAPVNVIVNAAPGQSATEIGNETAKHVDRALGVHLRAVKANGG